MNDRKFQRNPCVRPLQEPSLLLEYGAICIITKLKRDFLSTSEDLKGPSVHRLKRICGVIFKRRIRSCHDSSRQARQPYLRVHGIWNVEHGLGHRLRLRFLLRNRW